MEEYQFRELRLSEDSRIMAERLQDVEKEIIELLKIHQAVNEMVVDQGYDLSWVEHALNESKDKITASEENLQQVAWSRGRWLRLGCVGLCLLVPGPWTLKLLAAAAASAAASVL